MVCGQAQPHHTRPKIAVRKKMPTKIPTRRSIKSMESVGTNVRPSSVNSRWTTSSNMTGLPAIDR
jgi:hypothetical protein